MQKLNLTLKQFAEIKTIIKSRCCNCYQGNCLLLDDGDTHTCPQLITPSHIICRYFLACVLPSDNALLKSVTGQTPAETIVCALCVRKLSEQAEIRNSVLTVRRRNSGKEMQNICLQKGLVWMFMMP